MILATSIQSEKGKTLQKTANEYLNIDLYTNRLFNYRIHFTEKSISILKNGLVLYQEIRKQ